MILNGRIVRVNQGSLLLREIGTDMEILVNTPSARNFSVGECVRVIHNGEMTLSIPPQVTAISIQRTQCAPVPVPPRPPFPPRPPAPQRPSQMNVTVQRRERNGLLVRETGSNRNFFVRTPHAQHFCQGQRLRVTFNTMTMNRPPEIIATEIIALC